MAVKRTNFLGVRDVPDFDGPVVAAARQRVAVRRKRQAVDRGRMSAENGEDIAGLRIANMDGMVGGGDGKNVAIGGIDGGANGANAGPGGAERLRLFAV